MPRLRTHHNRRRAKELKQGGLYTLQLHPVSIEWGQQMVDVQAELRAWINRALALPPEFVTSGPRL